MNRFPYASSLQAEEIKNIFILCKLHPCCQISVGKNPHFAKEFAGLAENILNETIHFASASSLRLDEKEKGFFPHLCLFA
jgi:hypothetical protein